MKNAALVFLFIAVTSSAQAQYWIQRGGGQTIDEAMDIASDGANYTYTTGYFTSTATFSGNSIVSAGLDDIFIIKTNVNGNITWFKSAGGSNIDKALSIDADSAGNIVITGFFYTTANFDAQSVTSAGQQDIFIAKYNTSGTLLWVKRAGGAGSDVGNGVTFDNAGNVIVTGEFSGSCSFGTTTLTSMGGSIDVFTAKYDGNGNFLWAKKGSGTYTDRGTDVSTDVLGNIYVSGMFSDTITFDQTHNNPMYNAMFLIKYNSAGAEQWFRWMGSGTVVNMGGVAAYNTDVNITGNFNGTLYFFGGTGNPTLNSSYANDVFVCRYDDQGNLIWSHADGSSSGISSEAIATKSNGEVITGGNFQCRFSDLSALYGAGIFCSIGYSDTYVASYDNSGNLMWGRQYGGPQNDFLYGLTVLPNSSIANAGSYGSDYYATIDQSSFTAHGINGTDYTFAIVSFSNYCSDNHYDDYIIYHSYGNSDVFINSDVDLNRQPYDYFERHGTVCNRPFNDICIGNSLIDLSCPDTIKYCGETYIGVDLNLYNEIAPDFNYLWSTGATTDNINVTTSGYYNVRVTTADGCFSNRDTVYFNSLPIPPKPLITDSKGINTNALNTMPIKLCLPDSVTLTCTNPGTNTMQWNGYAVGQNPITVSAAGYYNVGFTNSSGCASANVVEVITGTALPAVNQKMRCLEDTDGNDTIELCLGQYFRMYLYDELTNPGGTNPNLCFPGMTYANWSANPVLSYNTPWGCQPYSDNYFYPTQVGTFFITISAWIIRANPCDTDSIFCNKAVHIIVHPVPTGTISIAINGPTQICFGDTAMLIATPDTNNYQWSTGETNDTIYVTQPGLYYVHASQTLTNSFGCTATISGNANITITSYPQPNVTMIPANGLICPNDSVKLLCSGTGTFNWQGPNGIIGGNFNSTYVNTPGFYYCIQTVAPGCDVVSNTVEVIQYNIPLIIAFPGPAICGRDTVLLTVITNPGSIIQWQPPLSGGSTTQLVHNAGTYTCNVTSCGILTPLTFTVHLDSALAVITASNPSLTICDGDSILLTANTGMTSYLWLPSGNSTLQTYAADSGIYTLITTSAYGCKDTASVAINEIPNLLTAPSATDTAVCAGLTVMLHASGNDTILWSSGASYNPVIHTGNSYQTPQLFHTITYYLYTHSGLCKSSLDSLTVSIDENCDSIAIPNIFTPNGDGTNDMFPGSSGYYKIDLTVYNRWGNLVYDSHQSLKGWDGRMNAGKELPGGTYYYFISVSFFDGYIQKQRGFLTLLRSKE
jgi:gliding motility-associated-like protein